MKIKYSRIYLSGIVIILILILGIVLFQYNWRFNKNGQINNEFQIAKSIAASLPKELLKALEFEPTDTIRTEYQFIKNIMIEISRINTNARFTYLYSRRNGNLFFIAGSEPIESMDYSPHGQQYPNSEYEFNRPFSEGKAFVTSAWGKWRSALVPIKNEATGKTIAVFGMDFTVNLWNKDLWIYMSESSLLILLLLLTLLYLLKILDKNKSLQLENTERWGGGKKRS